MKTKITQTVKNHFISEKESFQRYGNYSKCGNYSIVTRAYRIKVGRYWLPILFKTIMTNVDSVCAVCALGGIIDYNNCFNSFYQI